MRARAHPPPSRARLAASARTVVNRPRPPDRARAGSAPMRRCATHRRLCESSRDSPPRRDTKRWWVAEVAMTRYRRPPRRARTPGVLPCRNGQRVCEARLRVECREARARSMAPPLGGARGLFSAVQRPGADAKPRSFVTRCLERGTRARCTAVATMRSRSIERKSTRNTRPASELALVCLLLTGVRFWAARSATSQELERNKS